MEELTAQARKRVEDFSSRLELGLDMARPFLQQYLDGEKNRTARFRLDIVWYQLGQLMRGLVYGEVSPSSPRASGPFIQSNIGDALANILILAEVLHIDAGTALTEALTRLEGREWRKS